MLRTSSYTIYVDLPDAPEAMLLVHGYTGAFDRVSRPVAEYVQSREAGPPPKPLHGEWVVEPAARPRILPTFTPSDATLDVLTRRGYLTDMTPDQEVGYFARRVKQLHATAMLGAPNYIFMPTYDCNLRCSYCFQDHMRTNPQFGHLLRTVRPPTVDAIVSAFPKIEARHGIEPGTQYRRNIGLFGGEPLLAANRPIIEYLMSRVLDLGPARFWAVSNATELDAYADLIGPEGISEIQITLDGPPEEHDQRRIYADGSGSFARIARNIDLTLARDAAVSLRMNIDRANIAQLPALADVITAQGWDKHPKFMTYTAPVTASEPTISLKELKSRYYSSWELDQAIDALRERHPTMSVIGGPDDQMTARVQRLFTQRPDSAELRTAFCGAHATMYIFDAFGDIYACWEKTGDTSIRIGRVFDDGEIEINEGLNKLWRTRTPATNPTCRQCRYALQCGGGCAVLAEGRGKFHSNYCDGFADRFRNSVATAYGAFRSGEVVSAQARVCDL